MNRDLVQPHTTSPTDAALPATEHRAVAVNVPRALEISRLPDSHRPYADKYFLRSGEILAAEELNPWVRAQVFIRKGPGEVRGMDEALAILDKFSDLKEQGGRVYTLKDGDFYSPKETLMVIDAPVQSIIELETMYLGVLTAQTTRFNDDVGEIDCNAVRDNMAAVVDAADGRPVTYFGPRHWHWSRDAAITRATFEGGAVAASSDIGAAPNGKVGVGTIPHALENVYAFYYGKDRAVVESTKAFDRVIDPDVPRVALVDYNNKEIDDSIATADALEGRLSAVRVDTCGENIAQGALSSPKDATDPVWNGVELPSLGEPESKYWYGNGVSITGVYALRKALDAAGHKDVKIFLTSGFGDVEKVKAFVAAERGLGVRLFDGLGVGSVVRPARYATMDIVAVGLAPDQMRPVSKVGRSYNPNSRLKPAEGY